MNACVSVWALITHRHRHGLRSMCAGLPFHKYVQKLQCVQDRISVTISLEAMHVRSLFVQERLSVLRD